MITYSFWKYYDNGRLAGENGGSIGICYFLMPIDIQMEIESKLCVCACVCCYSREVSKKE